MRSAVRFAAWIPAICATTSASPFGRARRRAAVSGAIWTVASATARRRGQGLPADVDHGDLARCLVHVGEIAHRRALRSRWTRPERWRGCGSHACRRAVAVKRAEHAAEPVDHALRVRIPPAGTYPTPVGVRELDVRQRLQSLPAVGSTDPRRASTAPRRLHRTEGVRVVVVPDRACPQGGRSRSRERTVARPDGRAERERRVVRHADRLAHVVERRDRDDGAEDLLTAGPGRRRLASQHGRLVEPAGEPDLRASAPPQTTRAPSSEASATMSSTTPRWRSLTSGPSSVAGSCPSPIRSREAPSARRSTNVSWSVRAT